MNPTHPKFPSFVGDWEGAQKCFIPRDQTTKDVKSHHLQAPVTLTALSVPPRPPFLSEELWVICYHISNLSQLCITIYILALSYKRGWTGGYPIPSSLPLSPPLPSPFSPTSLPLLPHFPPPIRFFPPPDKILFLFKN